MRMEYLSPSRLSRFSTCELSFRFRYLDPPSWEDSTTEWYAAYGSLMHEIYEKLAKATISRVDALELYDKHYPYCYVPEANHPDYYLSGKASIDQKASELANIDIIGIEKEFNVMLDFSTPPLHGFIDLIYQDEFGYVVRDYKTSKIYDTTLMKKQMQPYVYALACKELYGEYPYKFEFDFTRFEETKSFMVNDSFIKMGIIKIKNYWNKIQSSSFPATYNPFFCNNFCEFKSVCPTYQLKVNS